MVEKEEKKFYVEGKWITESQIPEIFNLGNLFDEFRQSVENLGMQKAVETFTVLLRKQLRSLIQEVVTQPLTQTYFYHLKRNEKGTVSVHDNDYPQNTDIVKRSNPYVWYNLDESEGINKLYQTSELAQPFIDRFLLEYEQIRLLIDQYLTQDPLLSHSLLNELSQVTEPQEITLENGTVIEGFVSNWYAMGMPATKVHKGGGSYFNIYRIIAVPKDGSDPEYYIQKQGYFHKLSWRKQVNELINLDQVEKFIPKNEQEFMTHIIQLHPRRNRETSEELLRNIGKKAGDHFLDLKISKARKRQQEQVNTIEQSIQAIFAIFEHELKKPTSAEQRKRLKIFFEGIGNPLILAKDVPRDFLVQSYHQTLAKGQDRNAFITTLLPTMPSMLQNVGGTFLCGGLSAGGLFKNGQGLAQGAHGFGGLDNCLTCPACGKSGILGNSCACGFARGLNLKEFLSQKHSKSQQNSSSSGLNSSETSTTSNTTSPLFKLFPSDITGSTPISDLFNWSNSSVGIDHLFMSQSA